MAVDVPRASFPARRVHTSLSPTFFFTVYSLGLRPVERLDPSPPLDFSDGVSGGVGIQIASRASPRARMCPREHHPRSIRVSPRTQRGARAPGPPGPPSHVFFPNSAPSTGVCDETRQLAREDAARLGRDGRVVASHARSFARSDRRPSRPPHRPGLNHRVSPRGATQIPQAEPPTHQLTTVERGPARHVTPLVSPHWLSVRKRHSHLKTRPRRKPKPPFAHQTLTVSSHPALPPPHHTGSIQGGPQGAPPRRQGGQGQGQGGRGCQEVDS